MKYTHAKISYNHMINNEITKKKVFVETYGWQMDAL